MILELIWSKISHRFNVKMPWDDGLEMESGSPLLVAEAVEQGNLSGWKYRTTEFKEKSLVRENNAVWEPQKLTAAAVAVFDIMALNGGRIKLSEDLAKWLSGKGSSLDEVRENLIGTKLFVIDGEYLEPINDSTHLLTLDDESGFVSSEREKFIIWCGANDLQPSFISIVIF